MREKLGFFLRFCAKMLTVRRVALVLGLLGIILIIWGYLLQLDFNALIINLGSNLGAELIGMALTVILIDYLYQRQAKEDLMRQLIRELSSRDNGIALRALEELKPYQWLYDGTLRNIFLREANLEKGRLNRADFQEANLSKANLRDASLLEVNFKKAILTGADLHGAKFCDSFFLWEIEREGRYSPEDIAILKAHFNKIRPAILEEADLSSANLQEADLTKANLRRANLMFTNLEGSSLALANLEGAQIMYEAQLLGSTTLRGATMPDGSHYDGRFNLLRDSMELKIKSSGKSSLNPVDAAEYFGVSIEVYEHGQLWAQAELSRMREVWRLIKEVLMSNAGATEEDRKANKKKFYEKLSSELGITSEHN